MLHMYVCKVCVYVSTVYECTQNLRIRIYMHVLLTYVDICVNVGLVQVMGPQYASHAECATPASVYNTVSRKGISGTQTQTLMYMGMYSAVVRMYNLNDVPI
jgi:hypothetical protein